MNYEKRLKDLERQAAAMRPVQYAFLHIPDITKDEWMALVAAGSDFSRAELERVIQQREKG